MSQILQGVSVGAGQPQVFGHPRGLLALFMTELWERFTYYGMRALLVLFLTDTVASGGFGLTDETATAIYSYVSVSYILSLPGGWIADRLIGARRAVWYGGIGIVIGNSLLALGANSATFFGGLMVITIGVGMLKPNISAMVADLYPEGGVRRDAGFTLFYLGINLGAFLGPLATSTLRQYFSSNVAFGACAVLMVLGLLQYKWTQHYLGDAGLRIGATPGGPSSAVRLQRWTVVVGIAALIFLSYLLIVTGVIEVDRPTVPTAPGWVLVVLVSIAVSYFTYMFTLARLENDEKRRMVVMLLLFIACALFWAGFEQTGASMNLFAERYVDRTFGSWQMPAEWFQYFNSVFIVIFAAPFSMLWVSLAKRNLNPSAPAKFAFALILLGLGSLFMVIAASIAARGQQAMPYLLTLTYLLHTYGELCLSPVGLSYVTKLAPSRFVSQMMGLWFMATSIGSLAAGWLVGRFDTQSVQAMPGQLMNFVYFIVAAGLLLLVLSKPVKSLIGGVK